MTSKKIILSIILSSFFMCGISSGVDKLGHTKDSLSLPFVKGEKFIYDIRYKKLSVGEATLVFHGEEEFGPIRAYHVTFFTKLSAWTDNEELFADKATFLPLEVQRTIQKFGTLTTRITEKYDQENFKVEIRKKSKFRSRELSIKKDSPIHNAILLTYYCRGKKDFKKGERFKINLPTVDFDVIFNGEETVETPLGEFLAYSFTSDPPKFKFWLSMDDRRVPLKIENPSKLEHSLLLKSIGAE